MLKTLSQHRWLLLLVALTGAVRLFAADAGRVERYYTYGLYPPLATGLRTLFGWLPFSFGDLLYGAAGCALLYGAYRGFRRVRSRRLNRAVLLRLLLGGIRLALAVYLVFQLLWGLNYSRRGIAGQLALPIRSYGLQDVLDLHGVLLQRLNEAAARADLQERARLDRNDSLFAESVRSYRLAARTYGFLQYRVPSLKPSLYTHVGHYFGFTGYYNPFSGEAQIKTTIPTFLKPFVSLHEIAHQVGYARENEANFIAFLVGRQTPNPTFRYALYYGLYRYALREVYNRDPLLAAALKDSLHRRVQLDNEALRQYFLRTENKIEPLVTAFYDQYLKLNEQKKGVETYNEVVALLIAWQKKHGRESI